VEQREHIRPSARESRAESWARRLAAMGIEVQWSHEGGATLATMPLSAQPFPALERSSRFERVLFATVGRHHLKCLKPAALFYLPLIDVRGCESQGDIEARIRTAWLDRIGRLGECWERLRKAGAACAARAPDSVIRVGLDGEAERFEASIVEPGELILPSRGPLAGLGLASRDERVFKLGRIPDSDAELQLSIGKRLDEIVGAARKRPACEQGSSERLGEAGAATLGVRSHRVLLVGPRLSRDRESIDSLGLRGYTIDVARSATEAMRLYQRCTPELVLADADLGRGEGLELVPMLQATPGVDHIPVIVVDRTQHAARRAAAKRIGAAGYIAGQLQIAKIAERLTRMLDAPARRRFTRYTRRLELRLGGSAATATELSRAGLLVATAAALPSGSLLRCELALSDTGRAVEVEAEVLYRLEAGGSGRGGVGLRFDRFGADGEGRYLEFLRELV